MKILRVRWQISEQLENLWPKFKFNKLILNHILASTILFVSFLPWALFIIINWSNLTSGLGWMTNFQISVLERILTIIFNTSTVLVDFNNQFNFKNPLPYLIFIIIIYSFWFMYRKAPFHTFLFIALLVIIPGLSQIIPDFLIPRFWWWPFLPEVDREMGNSTCSNSLPYAPC